MWVASRIGRKREGGRGGVYRNWTMRGADGEVLTEEVLTEEVLTEEVLTEEEHICFHPSFPPSDIQNTYSWRIVFCHSIQSTLYF